VVLELQILVAVAGQVVQEQIPAIVVQVVQVS
jgi:hypothetical protein